MPKPLANPIVVHSIRPCSRGLSVRKLPPPSLSALHEIANYYEKKASGDYDSLSTRYLFLMIRELRHVLAGLGGGGGCPLPLESHHSRIGTSKRAMRGSDPWRHHARSWCDRSAFSGYTESTSAEELRGAVEYLEASLDAAKLHVAHVERTCQEQMQSQSDSFRTIINEERVQFESLYSQSKAECTRMVEKAKLETEVVRRDSQAVIAMVQRDAQETLWTLKSEFEKEKAELIKRHREETEALKAEHVCSRDRMSELLGKAKRDEQNAVLRSRKALIRKHEAELLRIRKDAATKSLQESKQYEKETVLGSDGVELLARIIQNRNGEARDILVESLLDRQNIALDKRSSATRPRNGSKRYRGNGPSRGPAALFDVQPSRPTTVPSSDRSKWRY